MKTNGFEYHEYIWYFVDDVLCISYDPGKYMNMIHGYFKIKDDNTSYPDMYLGATLYNISLEGSKTCWTVSADRYVKS